VIKRYGERFCVSVCNSSVFKDLTKIFDRAGIFFESAEPLITYSSIQFANGSAGR